MLRKLLFHSVTYLLIIQHAQRQKMLHTLYSILRLLSSSFSLEHLVFQASIYITKYKFHISGEHVVDSVYFQS